MYHNGDLTHLSTLLDGEPQVFLTTDILNSQSQGWTPSPIVTINGEDVVEFLTKFAALNSAGTLEPHADWNQLMSSPAQDIQGRFSVYSGGATFYPGDDLVFALGNGTEIGTKIGTVCVVLYDEPNYTGPLPTGRDFYNYFVLGQLPESWNDTLLGTDGTKSGGESGSDDSTTDEMTNTSDVVDTGLSPWVKESSRAYPDNPDFVQPGLSSGGGGIVTGYFLDNSSTAVLSVLSFDMSGVNVGNFSNTTISFINRAT